MTDNSDFFTAQNVSISPAGLFHRVFPTIIIILLSVFTTFTSYAKIGNNTAYDSGKEASAAAQGYDWWHILLFAAVGGSVTAGAFLIYIMRSTTKRDQILKNDLLLEQQSSEMKTILKMLVSSLEGMTLDTRNPESMRIRLSAMLVGCRRLQATVGVDVGNGNDAVTASGIIPYAIPMPEESKPQEPKVDSDNKGPEIISEGDEDLPNRVGIIRDSMPGNDKETEQPNYGVMMTRDEDFMLRFEKILTDNIYDSNFGAEEIAAKLNMSRSSVYRRVKRITDQSIVDYIRMLRLRRSRMMLEEGHGVSETAFACGFGDAGYFSITFKKEYGVTPTQFKKKFTTLRT